MVTSLESLRTANFPSIQVPLVMLVILSRIRGEADDDCWPAGSGLSRAMCCYEPDVAMAPCWNDYFTPEVCCRPAKFYVGLPAFGSHVDDNLLQKTLTLIRRRASHLEFLGNLHWPSAVELIAKYQQSLLVRLRELRNESLESGKLPMSIMSAYFLFMVYFVALEAMQPWLSRRSRSHIVRSEGVVWTLWADIYRSSFGYTDLCRCMEGGDAYSKYNSQLEAAGVGSHTFAKALFNATYREHHIIRSQQCGETPEEHMAPENSVGLMFSTGCVPGDLGIALLLLQSCILEQQISKALALSEFMSRMATMGSECHDAAFWRFTMRDFAQQHAKMMWEIAKRPAGFVSLELPLLRRLAWNALRDTANAQPPWYQSCGPHELVGPIHLSMDDSTQRPGSTSRIIGPCCTEIGRFWLQLQTEPAEWADRRILLIIPVTFPWWANPYHHFHWWVPALWHVRIVLKLRREDTVVGLAFPHKDANWGKSVTAKPTTLERSEPTEWSFLQGTWPRTDSKSLRPWSSQGLHHDVLNWLSTDPARPLSELMGRRYKKVIIGIPPIRFHVQSPRPWCSQIAAVRNFVMSTRTYRMYDRLDFSRRLALEHAQPGKSRLRLRQLTILQRPEKDGRTIENLDQIVALVREQFSDRLDVQVIERLTFGTPWTEQFRIMALTDILFAAHGGALGWSWALRPGGALIELWGPGAPFWMPCSHGWNVDTKEMYGGMARLAGSHHICIRPHAKNDAKPGQPTANEKHWLEWERTEAIMVDPTIAQRLLVQALSLMQNELPPTCN